VTVHPDFIQLHHGLRPAYSHSFQA
jgi:hypothetical protein